MPSVSTQVRHDVDSDFERFLQGFPADWEEKMRAHGAFTYAGKIASPPALLRAIFLYCGLDPTFRIEALIVVNIHR